MADPIKPKYGKKATETKSPKQKRFQSPEEMETEEGMQPEATVTPQASAKTVTNAPADKLPTAPTVAPEVTKDYSKGMTLEEAERMTPEQRRAVGLTDELYERQSQKYQEVKGNFSNYGKGQHWVNTEASAKNNMFAGNTPAATDIAASNVAINPLATNPNKATVKPKMGGGDLRTQTRKEAMRAGTYYDDAGKAATYWDAKSQTRKMKDGTEMASAVKPKGGSSKTSKKQGYSEEERAEMSGERTPKQWAEWRKDDDAKKEIKMKAFGKLPNTYEDYEKQFTPAQIEEYQKLLGEYNDVKHAAYREKTNRPPAKDQSTSWDKFTGLYQDSQTVKPKRGTPLQEAERSAQQNGYKQGKTEANSLKDAYNNLMLEANKNYNKDTGAGVKGWHEHHSVAEKLIGRPLTEDEKTEFNVKVSNGTMPHQALGAIIKKDLVPSEDYKRGVEEGKKKYLNTKKGFNKIISSEDAHMKIWGKILSQEEFNAASIKDRLKFTQAMYGKAAPKNEEELIKFGEAFDGQHNDNTAQLEAVAAYRSAKGKSETTQATTNPMQVKTDTVKPKGFPKWDDKTRSEGQKASLKEVRAELRQQKEQAYEMADAKEAFNTGLEFGRQEYKARKPIPENPDSDSGRVDEIKKLAKKEGYNIISPMGVNRGTITYKPTGKSQITELPKGVKPDSTGVVTLTVDEFEAMRKASVAKKPSTVKPKKQPKK